jgi:ligand-binding SRPBCC domain-containing protein
MLTTSPSIIRRARRVHEGRRSSASGELEAGAANQEGAVGDVSRTVENHVVVPAPAPAVWARVVHPDGINHEMRPWLTMTMPRGARGLTVETLPLGRPLGRAWLRLFGLIPFDFDHLTIVELDSGRRFLEQSTMLSMRRWEHERTLTPVAGGTRVHDRVTLEPRLPIPGLALLLGRVVDAFFKHRHRRLQAYFGGPASRPEVLT